ncbi:hypothetical protein [Natronolimnobius baerhuensis]|uniref:Uncharacterized protein n=1 Tax=Natronolimnobius baerhuensis TaxID=253108 RepID=A0A202E3Z4_9EURY|nr:hypothetical protein [Natronolimnobius baerhuensis]OVE82924.1 hypothetical protein B2G88_18195 [Natronolimnobius baerhuensis]
MAEQVESHDENDTDELTGSVDEVPDDKTVEWGEVQWVGLFGLISSYFVFSGSIALFQYLDWIGIAPMIASAVEPLPEAVIGILGVISLFVNFVLMGLLLWNAEFVKNWLEENTTL